MKNRTTKVTLKKLIHEIAELDAEGMRYAWIAVRAVGALDDDREMYSALMSSVAYELSPRMLKLAAHVADAAVRS